MEIAMQVARWGNSLAVRLPKKLVDEMKLAPGDEVQIVRIDSARFGIEKSDRRAEAIARMAQRKWKAPDGYRFDREEANER
jgi:antitoxin MazE